MDKFARLRRGYGGQAAELKLAHAKSVQSRALSSKFGERERSARSISGRGQNAI